MFVFYHAPYDENKKHPVELQLWGVVAVSSFQCVPRCCSSDRNHITARDVLNGRCYGNHVGKGRRTLCDQTTGWVRARPGNDAPWRALGTARSGTEAT